jgi:HEAT repeat protein
MRTGNALLTGLALFMLFAVALDGSQIADEIYNQGIAHYTGGNYRDAEFYLGQVLHDNPSHHAARFYFAAAMAMQGKAASALPHLEYLLKIDPVNPAYRSLHEQISRTAAARIASTGARPDNLQVRTDSSTGDAYIPGVKKLTETGGGMVPLISASVPAIPVPLLPEGYEKLRQDAASPDPQIRRDAIRSLIERRDSHTIPLLVWALSDQPCRELAGRALVNLGNAGIEKIIGFIDKSSSSGDKKFALALLGRFTNDQAAKTVMDYWKKADPELLPTLESLIVERGSLYQNGVLETLKSQNQVLKLSAAQILQKIGKNAILPLFAMVRNARDSSRTEAVAILDGMSREEVFQTIPRAELEILKDDSNSEVAAFAASLLPATPVATAPEIIP